MERLKIQLPEKEPLFQTDIQVRVTDLNYGNHLGNDRLIGLLHEVRCLWLKELGQSELSFYGAGLILTDLRCQFLSQGYLHNLVEASLIATPIHERAFSLFYCLKHKESQKLMAKAQTTMCAFDYDQQKIKPIPQEFLKNL